MPKGGLLYHFGTKHALEAGLIARLRELVDEDVAAIESGPEGPVAYFLRSSVMEDAPLDRAIIAAAWLSRAMRWRSRRSTRCARVGRKPFDPTPAALPRPRDARERRPVLQQRARR
ncbi:hypothetical protein J7E29_11255 [Streptomyces sp. ISL-90]|nr:hypothetical protein [Streptomyces sp. ISL-90]